MKAQFPAISRLNHYSSPAYHAPRDDGAQWKQMKNALKFMEVKHTCACINYAVGFQKSCKSHLLNNRPSKIPIAENELWITTELSKALPS